MRRLRKTLLIAAICVVVIIGGLYLYLFHLDGVESIVNAKIASLAGEEHKLDIKIGEIRGDVFSDLIVEDVTVFYDDSLCRYQMLDLPRLSVSYSIANLWNREYVFDYLYIDSALVTLIKDSSGHWVVPDFTSGGAEGGRPKAWLPAFAVGEIGINHLSINLCGPDDTTTFDNVSLSLAVRSEEDTYAAHVRRFEFTSNKKRLELGAAGGKLTFAEGGLVFKDISLVSGETRIKLDGNVSFRQALRGQVDFAIDHIDLADVTAYIGPDLKGIVDLNGNVSFVGGEVEGSVDLGGDFLFASLENLFADFRFSDKSLYLDTVYGTILGGCAIDGNAHIDFSGPVEKYRLVADVKHFNLENLVEGSFGSSLNGSIVLNGESFRNRDMALKIEARLHESSFDDYSFHRAVGRMVITTDSISFLDSFRIDYYENIFYVAGRIDYSDESELKIAANLRNLDRYKGKLFIEQPGGGGYSEATISGRTADPDLKGIFVSDSLWLYGLYCDSLYATVDLRRFLTGKQGTVEVDYRGGSAWGIPYDTAYAFLTVDSTVVYIDSAFMTSRFSSVTADGAYDYGAEPSILIIDSMRLIIFDQAFHNHDRIDINIDSAGFDFRQAAIRNNGAMLAVAGRADYDETMDLALLLDRIPIEPWKNLFDESLEIGGYLSCDVSLQGSFEDPRFRLRGNVDSLVYRDLLLGDLSAHLWCNNKLLTIDSVQVLSHPGEYRADGSFYVDLAFTTDSIERFPDLPMWINISANDSRFDLVSLMMPSVEQLDGDFYADFVISGTPHEPHLEGEAYMKNARLKYFDLQNPIYADSAGVTMSDNRIIIDRVDTYVVENAGRRNEKKSYAVVQGDIVVKSFDNMLYDVEVDIPDEFPFAYELDDIYGSVKGRLHIEGETPPLVTGDVQLISMKYLANFAEEDEGSPLMSALSGEGIWDLDINVDILSNYWIKNDDIDAEFAGEINLIRENGVYRFIGEMEVLRGRGFLLDKVFRLEPGSRVMFEGNETINPRLDIVGYTRIATTRASVTDEDEITEQLLLGIHVTGTLEEPEINPTETSDFASRDDILPLIIANYYSSDTASAQGSFERRLTDMVSSRVSQIGSRQLGRLGVETFEIDPSFGSKLDPLDTRVTLGFYTSPNLYVYGRSALSGQSRQEVGFEYRFNRSFLLQGVRDEEELYHLNLRLHWEF